ncbi:alcohol dehydrogenase catalytic domain-containing protein [Dactylosporangium sp. NPDC049140]|uniref:alcohol dehydrogenase catalytic domain-containing protein n=1 Tax=Dactylosporangium sp. NPDC049140 TaxID=3155647 RepID=UPI0033DB1E51
MGVGSAVSGLAAEHRVLASRISACGVCRFCRAVHSGQCLGGGGWILGHRVDGVQAEYARLLERDPARLSPGVTRSANGRWRCCCAPR